MIQDEAVWYWIVEARAQTIWADIELGLTRGWLNFWRSTFFPDIEWNNDDVRTEYQNVFSIEWRFNKRESAANAPSEENIIIFMASSITFSSSCHS